MNPRVEKILKEIIRWGSFGILFLPLLIYRPTLYPFIFGKIIVFRILVEIMVAAWLFLAVYNRKYRPNWRNPLILGLTIFTGVLFLTMFTGVDIHRSFWSTQERMTGVLTIIHFYGWFLVLTSCFRNWQDWRRFIWLSLASSFLVGFYGLGQRLGWRFLIKEGDIRMSATLGNPDFLGVYAMCHAYLAGFLVLIERKWILRGLAIFLSGFSLTILFLTATRGAIVAFGLSFLLFLVFLIFLTPTKLRKDYESTKYENKDLTPTKLRKDYENTKYENKDLTPTKLRTSYEITKLYESTKRDEKFLRTWKWVVRPLLILLIVAIVGGGIFLRLHKDAPWMKKAPLFVQRVVGISVEANRARFVAWKIALMGFKEKPVLGWGWENYSVVFNKHYDPWYMRAGAASTWFDKSHNQVLDLAALTGAIGIGAYLSVFGALFWLLFRKLKSKNGDIPHPDPWARDHSGTVPQKISLLILGTLILAYFIQNLFVFDTPAPLIVFYFGLGLSYFITSEIGSSRLPKYPSTQVPKYPSTQFPLPVLIFLIIIFLPWGIYKFNLEPLQQSKLGVRAISISHVDLKYGLEEYKKALAKPCFTNPEIRLQLAKTIVGADSEDKDYQEGLEFAISQAEKNTKEHPIDARYWLFLGQLYNQGANYDIRYLDKADEALNRALEISPKRQQIYYELIRTKIAKKENEEAIDLAKQALELDEEIKDSHWNLGLAYIAAKKYKEGLAETEKAWEMGYRYGEDILIVLYLANAYSQVGNYEMAISYCDTALKWEPENIQAMGSKAIYLAKSGKPDEAEKIVEDMAEINKVAAEQLKREIKGF